MANKALLIDDDISTLELMKFQLEAEGFEVTIADSGRKGFDFVKTKEYDIILTDLNLPDFNGIEMVSRCKEISLQKVLCLV